MLRWIAERLTITDVRRQVRFIQEELGSAERHRVCELVQYEIFLVKEAFRLGAPRATVVERSKARSAYMSPRHYPRYHPEKLAGALLSDWIDTWEASNNGAISTKAFLDVDDQIWAMTKEVLSSNELDNLYVAAERDALQHIPNGVAAVNGFSFSDLADTPHASVRVRFPCN